MAAYIVARYNVTNPEGFGAYPPAVGPTLGRDDVEILVVDGASEPIEGEPPHVTVVLKFPDKEAAKAWYNSSEYEAIRHHRTDNSVGDMVLVDGFTPPA